MHCTYSDIDTSFRSRGAIFSKIEEYIIIAFIQAASGAAAALVRLAT